MKKICTKCREEKEDTEFRKWQTRCKDCRNQYFRERRQNANPVLLKARDALYRRNKEEKNREGKAYLKHKRTEQSFGKLILYLHQTNRYTFTTVYRLLMQGKPILIEDEFRPIIEDLRKYFKKPFSFYPRS